jgi:hypothetical protein
MLMRFVKLGGFQIGGVHQHACYRIDTESGPRHCVLSSLEVIPEQHRALRSGKAIEIEIPEARLQDHKPRAQ